MSFLSVLLGLLVGGIISTGAVIGITFISVPWWALLLIGVGGSLAGGLVAGLIARGAGAGALAGFLSGILVIGGLFAFFYFYYKQQILDIVELPGVTTTQDLIDQFLPLLGVVSGTPVYDTISGWILTAIPDLSTVQTFVNTNFVWFALILGAIFGGVAAVTNLFAGLIGGLITRKKEENYDSYY